MYLEIQTTEGGIPLVKMKYDNNVIYGSVISSILCCMKDSLVNLTIIYSLWCYISTSIDILYLSLLIQLVYLPEKKRGIFIDDDAGSINSEFSGHGRDDLTNFDELVKDYRKNRRRGMLGWFKLKVCFCCFLLVHVTSDIRLNWSSIKSVSCHLWH